MPESTLFNISRRTVMGSIPLAASAILAPSVLGAVIHKSNNFDPENPDDNLQTYLKMQYSLVKEPVWSYFGGAIYALEGDLPPRRIFELDGFGQGWVDRQPDGSYHLAWKELGLLKDPVTSEVLDRWHNPLIDETVDVRHIMNPAANGTLRAREPALDSSFVTSGVDMPPRNFRHPDRPNDFILPWTTIGAYTSVWNDVALAMNHTLDPKIWVRESSGSRISIGEFFQLVARTDELFDPRHNQVPYTGSWQRLASWHPWMLMGQRPGKLFYRCTTQRITGPEQLPPKFLAEVHKRAPEYLEQPTTWGPRYSTWKNFLETQTPKPLKVR